MANKVKNEHILKQYIPLKQYSNDLPYDLGYIIESRFSRFKSYLETFPLEQMKTAVNDFKFMCSEVPMPSEKIRLYIFNDFNRALFVALDVLNSELKNITETLDDKLANCPKKFRTKPEYISTIYVFQGSKLIYSRDLYPSEVAEIISYYHSSDFLIHKKFA